jgi:stage IV sporulation protein FB
MLGQIGPTEFDLNFRAFGVPVRVHPIFWLTSAWLAWNMTPSGPQETQFLPKLIVGILCIFVAILVHELGHALMNRRFGFHSEIVLYILGGYATSTRHSTWRDIAVSAAGPGAGFLLFGASWLGIYAYGGVLKQNGDAISDLALHALVVSFFINLVWNLVNLLPVSPLDGGQISREFFVWLRPRDGYAIHLQLAMLAAGAVALYSLYCYTQKTAVFGLDPIFLGLMFGFLCFQNFQQYQQHKGGGYR